ncbi:MAG: NAD-binding protein [Caulobacteraceae bacterium]|nr:NAD-binding protein [Caulobacteraceae bacterium]
MDRIFGSPLRNLATVIAFMLVVMAAATLGYMAAGWSFADAIYMVVMTVYTVGYEEVRPIDTPFLHALTMGLIILGCTGMILVTGALVQVLTFSQIQRLLGANRMKADIDRLKGHVVICGFGRIGVMLAKELAAGGAPLVVIERTEDRFAEARALGHLAIHADATDEAALIAAGVERARVVATVLPDDAANVFITLSARSLNAGLQIIARGEAPSTERKLIQAGADKVVLPTHIGAERIAEMVLFPETDRFVMGSERMQGVEKLLRDVGLDIEMVVVGERSAAAGANVEDLERGARGAFFVLQVNRRGGETVMRPPLDLKIEAGDSLVVVARRAGAVSAFFAKPGERPRAGRTTF